MKRIILALAALAFALPAFAADLAPVVKARPRILTTYEGTGWYYGLHAFADNQKVELSGATQANNGTLLSGLGGTFSVGAAYGATVGWMKGDGTTWKAIEVMASYKNINGTTIAQDPATGALAVGEVQSKWSFTERVKLGGGLSAIFDTLSGLNLGVSSIFPTLPSVTVPNAVANTTHPYLFIAGHQDDVSAQFGLASGHAWRLKGGFGVGAMTQLTSGVVMDVFAEYLPAGQSLDLGAPNGAKSSANVGRESRIGIGVYW